MLELLLFLVKLPFILIGAVASFVSGMVGLVLAVIGELEGKPDNQVNIRTIVEMTMLGADNWPLLRVLKQIAGRNRKEAITSALFSLGIGLVGCVAGIYLVDLFGQLFTILRNAI